jgi:hypothetical protein
MNTGFIVLNRKGQTQLIYTQRHCKHYIRRQHPLQNLQFANVALGRFTPVNTVTRVKRVNTSYRFHFI